jgi:hypothetical protein
MIGIERKEPQDCSAFARLPRHSEHPWWHKGSDPMDATTVQITTKAYLAEISQRLDEAASIAKAAQACDAGNTKQGITIALDVEQLIYEANTLLNAATLINRISKG